MDQFRVIPGYPNYSVNRTGVIVSGFTGRICKTYSLNGYVIIDAFGESITETLPVHRAVALAWVDNPEGHPVVNHIDGHPTNNNVSNLEWVTYSENNIHAIVNGLRSDNVVTLVREFGTWEITEFPSITTACAYMGYKSVQPMAVILPKRFGALVNGKYEVRFKEAFKPWFYDMSATEPMVPAQYQVTVKYPDGKEIKLYNRPALIKAFQLRGANSLGVPAIVKLLVEKHPELEFALIDAYQKPYFKMERDVITSKRRKVVAKMDGDELVFSSLRACAEHFKVDRSLITNRIKNTDTFRGWSFEYLPA